MRILRHPEKVFARPAKAVVSGFDFPVQLVGVSKWLGSDGKPVMVYVDPQAVAKTAARTAFFALAEPRMDYKDHEDAFFVALSEDEKATMSATGLSVAQYVLSKIDGLMNSCDSWFGVRGHSGNVVIAPDFGGAYHYGCSFSTGGTWYESLSSNETTLGLVMAEVSESYMGLQNKGWDCGGSGGEALSRFLAEVATGGASGAMVAYSSGPSWDGTDWISRDQGTDQDYPSIGCGILYLWWLVKQGYSVQQIVQAGEPVLSLASNYAKLTGKPLSQAFPDFKAAVAAVGSPASFKNDNFCNAPNPPYPVSGVPVPPTPPPAPVPVPVPVPVPSGPSPLQQWVDAIFADLENQFADRPYVVQVLDFIQAYIDGLFVAEPQRAAAMIDRTIVKDAVDAVFASLEASLASRPFIVMALRLVQGLVDQWLVAHGL